MGIKIKVNGREYDRPEELPPELRRLYDEALRRLGPAFADRDGNGIPDIAEGKATASSQPGMPSQIVVDGQTYGSLEEMPAEARRKYEDALRLQVASVVPNLPAKAVFKVALSLMKPEFRLKTGSTPALPSNDPIEPPSAESGLRNGLVVLAALVAALILAFVLLRAR